MVSRLKKCSEVNGQDENGGQDVNGRFSDKEHVPKCEVIKQKEIPWRDEKMSYFHPIMEYGTTLWGNSA